METRDREKTVVDLLTEELKSFKPFPVGRLDKDTEGLLLLTNDGQLSHSLLSPKKHVPKTYLAEISGRVGEEDIKAFAAGIVLDDGYKTLPSQLEVLERGGISIIKVTIYEGKFHQVKRMFKAVGKEVTYLKRLSMGELKLDESLVTGEFRELSKEELKVIGVP
jgi:16S rRNA pseudouridine516 synthase